MSYRPFETLGWDLETARAQAVIDERAAEELKRLEADMERRASRKRRKAARRSARAAG